VDLDTGSALHMTYELGYAAFAKLSYVAVEEFTMLYRSACWT
jgi:hypothetical protein